ncbi:hypothetical protein [Leptospira stimsonii]|uniref:Uncharacterized protein n=1 Tax=Leptospira stimsonii TaxID=2202203 RepID=A0A8B3D0L8_9LEPT|nr:hypothetical protein [Leptospira stimsonii]RHX88742.1 hypothetical protein DLM78_07435 [Leptospira stimsonii]
MWNSLSPNAKFSVVLSVIFSFLGFFSLGAMGFGLYYLVFPISESVFPHPNSFHGDWVWPTTILVSILWPLGFIFGAILFDFFKKRGWSTVILYFLYIPILWLWAATLWLYFIYNKM